jgi:hypothetical protein
MAAASRVDMKNGASKRGSSGASGASGAGGSGTTGSGSSGCGSSDAGNSGALSGLLVLRIACGTATRADLVRDLKSLVDGLAAGGLSAKQLVEAELAALVDLGWVAQSGARFEITPAGLQRAAALAGFDTGPDFRKVLAGGWLGLRDGPLLARALGADPTDRKLVAALAQPDGMRALIVQAAFDLGVDRVLSLGKLRTMLAVRALERAFGHKIKAALGAGSGLAAKPSRLLAGQLLRVPRETSSDGRLVAALANEQLGVTSTDVDALRQAVLRRHIATWSSQVGASPAGHATQAATPAISATSSTPAQKSPTLHKQVSSPATGAVVVPLTPAIELPTAAPRPANDRGASTEADPALTRPDLPGFVRAVRRAAEARADGWPGNRKAFVSHVWAEIRSRHPEWALSEIEFKAMLAEAHRTGGLVLANADLKDKRHLQDFEMSAIAYKNTVWHFVRVEEP